MCIVAVDVVGDVVVDVAVDFAVDAGAVNLGSKTEQELLSLSSHVLLTTVTSWTN